MIQAATAISGDDLQRLKAERLRAEQAVSAIAQGYTHYASRTAADSYTTLAHTLASLEGYRAGTLTPAEPIVCAYATMRRPYKPDPHPHSNPNRERYEKRGLSLPYP